jgi:NADH-quinone oxidoreductase subunit G
VLANLLDLPGFDYTSSDQVCAELRKAIDETPAFALKASARTLQSKLALVEGTADRDVPIYQVDAVVRRSNALQSTREALESAKGQGA